MPALATSASCSPVPPPTYQELQEEIGMRTKTATPVGVGKVKVETLVDGQVLLLGRPACQDGTTRHIAHGPEHSPGGQPG